jgi:hypothetical protein
LIHFPRWVEIFRGVRRRARHALPEPPEPGPPGVVEVLGQGSKGGRVSDGFLADDPLPFLTSQGAAHLLRRGGDRAVPEPGRGAVLAAGGGSGAAGEGVEAPPGDEG